MEKQIVTKVKAKKIFDKKLEIGDYIEHNGKLYIFEGWDCGTYPICIDVKTNKQVRLLYY